MDGVAAGFILLMVVLGGCSAFVADILGYKIGKKRLSIWHIRPKHVARISVTVAGMLIPLVTVLILYTASSDFRTWVNKGRAAIREAEIKTGELQNLNQKYVDQVKEISVVENKNRLIQSELLKNKNENDKQKLALSDYKKKLGEQKSQLGRLGNQMAVAVAKIGKLNTQNLKGAREFTKTLALLTSVQNRLGTEQKSLELAKADLSITVTARDKAQNDSRRAVDELNVISRRNDELTRTLSGLESNIESLKTEIGDLRTQRKESQEQATAAVAELDKLSKDVANFERIKSELMASFDDYQAFSRLNVLTYASQEEVLRISVPGGLDRTDSQNLLNSVLRRCKILASERGAKELKSFDFDGVAGFSASDKNRRLTALEINDLLVDQIAGSNENRVMVISSIFNRFAGEPVMLDMTMYPNSIVFNEGDIISEGRVDGRESVAAIYTQISEFVRTIVNPKARRVKLIPVKTREGESFGALTAEQILNAVTLIKSAPRVLRLQAVARGEIRRAGPLTFDLVIK